MAGSNEPQALLSVPRRSGSLDLVPVLVMLSTRHPARDAQMKQFRAHGEIHAAVLRCSRAALLANCIARSCLDTSTLVCTHTHTPTPVPVVRIQVYPPGRRQREVIFERTKNTAVPLLAEIKLKLRQRRMGVLARVPVCAFACLLRTLMNTPSHTHVYKNAVRYAHTQRQTANARVHLLIHLFTP
jgi:hypothetical protein